jgi:hypothetical protein
MAAGVSERRRVRAASLSRLPKTRPFGVFAALGGPGLTSAKARRILIHPDNRLVEKADEGRVVERRGQPAVGIAGGIGLPPRR